MSQPNTPSPKTNSNNTTSINAASHSYQVAMQSNSATPPATNNSGVLQMPGATRDVVMEDAPLHRPASPAAPILPPNAHSQTHSPILPPGHQSTANANRDTASPVPVPARTSTPVPKVNGNAENSSRATSQHPDTGPSLPTEASIHGAPARVYLNQTVTGSLLEGMKLLAKEQPKDPLRVLGEFLLSKSRELEGGN
ncbi:hypothetical protein MFRU_005g04580 [Monilinia fructicola]|uniref:Dpy-30 domain-containing protein n=1 Tax=Monilinia fructicola TaxID=38448 RepID=A0A5M9JLR1_MONFR|nr:hypothetical protein EYC84_002704 [Monilinia fructicola]KAG4033454.1 hypothetical protein MFRU_005g04580 [Monilinia fructicola]